MENNIEEILKYKYNQERKAAWKAKISMPTEIENSPKKRRYKFISWLVAACFLGCLGYFSYLQQNNLTSLANEYITATIIVDLHETNVRGKQHSANTDSLYNTDLDFHKAVKILKAGDDRTLEAISLLEKVVMTQKTYHIEAMWFKALALLRIEQETEALHQLHRLQAFSNYQDKKVKNLINSINS